MIKTLVTTVLIFTFSISFAQDDIGRSSWIAAPVKVDGRAEEWNQPLRYYDRNTKLFFAFANDDKNLYICFQTPEEINQSKIMRAGIEITLNTKNKHSAFVKYPIEQPVGHALADSNENKDQVNSNRTNMRSNFLEHHTMMEVKGFNSRNGLIPVNDTSGINAAINWDEANKLTYEIAVPLKELYGAGYTASDISKDISMEVKVNALSKEKNSGRGATGDGFSGRMGGGGRGEGMNHGRDSFGEGNAEQKSEDRTAMSQKAEFKEKFILAQASNPQ